jgi:hypothetical protein
MNNTDKKRDDLSLIDQASKLLAVCIGLLYLIGFLVVTSYLSRFGVSSFSVLQLQYLVVGVWVLAPPVVMVSFKHAEHMFQEKAAPDVSGRFNWRRFSISMFLTSVPFGLWFGVVAAVPGFWENMTWKLGIYWWFFLLGLQICWHILLISWRVPAEKETWLVNRQAAPFHLSLLVSVLLVYVLWFSVRIYPLIPFSLGGGRPLTVVFIPGEKELPQEIVTGGSFGRSIECKLLLVTDKSYVILSPVHDEESIEFPRDSVRGMVVLRDTHSP